MDMDEAELGKGTIKNMAPAEKPSLNVHKDSASFKNLSCKGRVGARWRAGGP